jgi:hypothetical protein
MKLILLIFITVFLISCSSKKYNYRSERCITSNDSTIYLKKDAIGLFLYNYWSNGYFGNDYSPVLVKEKKFKKLLKNTKQ